MTLSEDLRRLADVVEAVEHDPLLHAELGGGGVLIRPSRNRPPDVPPAPKRLATGSVFGGDEGRLGSSLAPDGGDGT